MTTYLDYKFEDSESFINTFDEAPLWSAAFGLLLLKNLEINAHISVIDIGCGTGFPLFELAGRLGPTCRLIGIDPWENACRRAEIKVKNYGYSNVEIINASADHMPFDDNSIDLIVSNLGINNFENINTVFDECNRVLKPGCKLALTTNPIGHWKEFYEVFYDTLLQLDMQVYDHVLTREIEHRLNKESISSIYASSGFQVTRFDEDQFTMQFVDGTAFLNHHFVKLGWISEWKALFPSDLQHQIFSKLETNLNSKASRESGLKLTVPMLFMEGMKPKDKD